MNVDWSTVGHAAVVDRRLSYLFNCFFQKKADAYVSFYLHWRILELDWKSSTITATTATVERDTGMEIKTSPNGSMPVPFPQDPVKT